MKLESTFPISENPNHYVIILGVIVLIIGLIAGYFFGVSNNGYFLYIALILIFIGSGILSWGYNKLANVYNRKISINIDLMRIERDIKREKLRLIKNRKS